MTYVMDNWCHQPEKQLGQAVPKHDNPNKRCQLVKITFDFSFVIDATDWGLFSTSLTFKPTN